MSWWVGFLLNLVLVVAILAAMYRLTDERKKAEFRAHRVSVTWVRAYLVLCLLICAPFAWVAWTHVRAS